MDMPRLRVKDMGMSVVMVLLPAVIATTIMIEAMVMAMDVVMIETNEEVWVVDEVGEVGVVMMNEEGLLMVSLILFCALET